MAKHRFKKFERGETPPGFRLGENDLKILKLLADCRFLDSRQLAASLPSQSVRNIQRRLHFLYHNGYIERPGQQAASSNPSVHFIYSLGKKGAGFVSQSKGSLAKNRPAKEIGVSFMRHALMVSDFRLVLDLALKKEGGHKLAVWKDTGPLGAVQFEGERLPIAPDAFFTIESKEYFTHFFLEADRSTMTLERMLGKYKGYWNWRLEGGHKQKLGISNFRVLTVCVSEERAENLRRIAKQAGGSGSEMFWFLSEKMYDLKMPETILFPVWNTSKDDNPRSLLD